MTFMMSVLLIGCRNRYNIALPSSRIQSSALGSSCGQVSGYFLIYSRIVSQISNYFCDDRVYEVRGCFGFLLMYRFRSRSRIVFCNINFEVFIAPSRCQLTPTACLGKDVSTRINNRRVTVVDFTIHIVFDVQATAAVRQFSGRQIHPCVTVTSFMSATRPSAC